MESAPPIDGTINVVGRRLVLWLHGLFLLYALGGGAGKKAAYGGEASRFV